MLLPLMSVLLSMLCNSWRQSLSLASKRQALLYAGVISSIGISVQRCPVVVPLGFETH